MNFNGIKKHLNYEYMNLLKVVVYNMQLIDIKKSVL